MVGWCRKRLCSSEANMRLPILETSSVTTTRSFTLFSVDNNTQLGINDGAELRLPDFSSLFSLDIIVPLITYMLMWYSVNMAVTAHCWTTWQEGIRRKRLINLTTSLIHSCVSTVFLTIFFCRNARLMFESPMHYYSYTNQQIVMLSIGYFIYDGFDMLINDKISIATGVLLVHHVASTFVLSTAIASRKFLLYAYWALLMEVSSIFLHSRSILHISKLSATTMIAMSRIISYFNIVSFVIFRFGVQTFLFGWAWVNWNYMHSFYLWIAFFGGSIFLLINIGLFVRILHSDGLFCSSVLRPEKLDAMLEDNEYSSKNTERKELLL